MTGWFWPRDHMQEAMAGSHADMVVLGIGTVPNVDLARNADLRLGPTGSIWVDRTMRTSDEHIFACGDCAEKFSFFGGRPLEAEAGFHSLLQSQDSRIQPVRHQEGKRRRADDGRSRGRRADPARQRRRGCPALSRYGIEAAGRRPAVQEQPATARTAHEVTAGGIIPPAPTCSSFRY